MGRSVYIYTLSHPITNEIRYVGKAVNIKLRLQSHIDYARSKNKQRPVSDWINSLLKNNLKPLINIIEETNENDWASKEVYWIKSLKEQGKRLLNLTDGGESNNGYVYSNELKLIRKKARLGKSLSKTVKLSISKSLSKKIICETTGETFDSMKDAIGKVGIPKSTFHRKLHKGEPINGLIYKMVQP